MSAGKVFGGLLALIGGFLLLIGLIYNFYQITSGIEMQIIRWIIALIACLLAIIGGVLAIASKGGGGGLVLIAGIITFIMPLIADLAGSMEMAYWFAGYSGLADLTGWGILLLTDSTTFFWYFSFEAFIIFLGAIIILNSRDNY
jgi:hypothetical protein